MTELKGAVALVTGSSEGPEFHADRIGEFVDPHRVAAAYPAADSFAQIHARQIAGEFSIEVTPIQVPEVKA